jgi:hypothetical protein
LNREEDISSSNDDNRAKEKRIGGVYAYLS